MTLLFLLAIPVPISVPVLLAIPVFAILAIFAIAIVIPVLALVHVNAIDEGAEGRELFILLQVIDQGKVVLVGEIGTADIDADIGHAGNQASVGDDADGGTVHNDVVEVLAQEVESFVQGFAGYQLRGIGGNGTSRQYIQMGG